MYANQDYFRYVPKSAAISVQKMVSKPPYVHQYVHMHGHSELALITTHAQVTITNNGNQKEIQAPALILHQAGSYHIMDTQEIGNNDDLGYCIFFSEQALKQVPASVLQADSLLTDQCLILTLNDEQCQKLTTYAELLYTESSNEKQLLLLLLLLAQAKESQSQNNMLRLNTPNNYVFDVTRYLITHLDEPLTAAQLAAHFHVSISKLNTDFQEIIKQTPKAFCIDLRISRAAELLRTQPKMPLAQIAYQCGFSSESYLIQCFQKKMQTTPNAYRRAYQASEEP